MPRRRGHPAISSTEVFVSFEGVDIVVMIKKVKKISHVRMVINFIVISFCQGRVG